MNTIDIPALVLLFFLLAFIMCVNLHCHFSLTALVKVYYFMYI